MTHAERLGRLNSLIRQASADELKVLLVVAERLTAGRERYGTLHLATDGRDFAREALEEAADLGLYTAMRLIQARERAPR